MTTKPLLPHETMTDLTDRLPRSAGWMHSGVAVLGDGTVACAHPEGHALVLLDPAGGTRVVPVPLAELHGIVRGVRDGREVLVVADPGNRAEPSAEHPGEYVDVALPGRAAVLGLDGSIVLELAQPILDVYADAPWRPTSVAIDDGGGTGSGSGDIWVADGYGASLVHRFDRDGALLNTFDGRASGTAFACPHGIMLRPADGGLELLVADRTNHRIVVCTVDGIPLRVFGTELLDSPSSLVVADGLLYATELFGGVTRFDTDIAVTRLGAARHRDHAEPDWPNRRGANGLTSPEVAPDGFTSPHGIATDGDSLYVTEWSIGGRLVRIPLADA